MPRSAEYMNFYLNFLNLQPFVNKKVAARPMGVNPSARPSTARLVSAAHPLLVAARPVLAPAQLLGLLAVRQRPPTETAAAAVHGAGALVPEPQHIANADVVAAGELLLQLAPLAALELAVRHVGRLLALLVAHAVRPEGLAGRGVAVQVDDQDDDGNGTGYGDEIEAGSGYLLARYTR